jgi:hypothetical protein
LDVEFCGGAVGAASALPSRPMGSRSVASIGSSSSLQGLSSIVEFFVEYIEQKLYSSGVNSKISPLGVVKSKIIGCVGGTATAIAKRVSPGAGIGKKRMERVRRVRNLDVTRCKAKCVLGRKNH